MIDSQENVLEQEDKLEEKKVENIEAAPETPIEEPVAPVEETPEAVAVVPAEEPEVATVEEQQAEETVAEAPAEETVAETEPTEEPAGEETAELEVVPEQKVYATKGEIIERLKQLAHGNEAPSKAEVDYLKTSFYKLHFAQREADQKAYLDAGGDPEKYMVPRDEDEDVFKAEMGVIKEKRQKLFAQQEAEKQENLQKKLDIIAKIKAMVTSPEEANKNFQAFKQLQQEWKEIKAVPAEKANELWRNYHLYVEQVYDLLKLNSEAREYDFKKNLETKTRLCEAAEKLADEPDVVSAFHQLQKLHQEYRETGPVAKELREEIWARFKAASTVINKKHQQHFEGIRSREEENLAKKTELCEKAEAIGKEENKGTGDWGRHTKQIIELQSEWKTIGFAPQKMNVKIFERFRAACDDFFERKAAYFKTLKQTFAENAERKQKLVEEAQSLQDSEDWKATSDRLVALQKEWKTIGAVPKKQSDRLWNDFQTACNKFFEARNQATSGTRSAERDNLEKKRGIIARLKEAAEEAGDDLQERVQQLVDEYSKVGHVPYREKDKVYKEYREVMDRLYNDLHISVARKRLDEFKNNIGQMAEKGAEVLDNERSRLMRRYETLKQEILTYENNLGFLNASSKKGNSLIEEMNRKVQKLRDDCELVKQKIKAIDEAEK